MSDRTVSVVISVKNEQKHVEEAITTVATQLGVSHEIVVIDDGSTDGTFAILDRLAAKFENMRLFKNARAGKVSAFNFGVANAKGDFVCLFAGDDIMPQGSLASRLDDLKDLPLDQPVIGLCKLRTMSTDKRYDGHTVPRRKGRGALSGVSPLMNRLAIDKIFPIPEQLPNEDTWMEICVLHYPGIVLRHSDVICCLWRLHEGNSINTRLPFDEFNRRYTSRMRALKLFLDRHGSELTSESRAALQAKVSCEASRIEGDITGILRTRAGMVDRLRAVALSGPRLYAIRNRLYGLLSGW